MSSNQRIIFHSPSEENNKAVTKLPDDLPLETNVDKLEETPLAPVINENDIKDYGLSRRLFRDKQRDEFDTGLELLSREEANEGGNDHKGSHSHRP